MIETSDSCDSIVVDYSSHNPKVKGLSQATTFWWKWQQMMAWKLASGKSIEENSLAHNPKVKGLSLL